MRGGGGGGREVHRGVGAVRRVCRSPHTAPRSTSLDPPCCPARPPPAGITFVSVGHRPTLLPFHEQVLLLRGGTSEGWEVRDASEISLQSALELMG